MGKQNDLIEGRNQGILYAYNIAKEKGIEALEEEIRYRNITNVNILVPKAEMIKESEKIRAYCTTVAIVVALATLASEYCWSEYMLRDFQAKFDARAERDAVDDKDLEHDLMVISSKGISISFEED